MILLINTIRNLISFKIRLYQLYLLILYENISFNIKYALLNITYRLYYIHHYICMCYYCCYYYIIVMCNHIEIWFILGIIFILNIINVIHHISRYLFIFIKNINTII
jgi:hypothetical protein